MYDARKTRAAGRMTLISKPQLTTRTIPGIAEGRDANDNKGTTAESA
jgi:hypothetical protein